MNQSQLANSNLTILRGLQVESSNQNALPTDSLNDLKRMKDPSAFEKARFSFKLYKK